MILDRRDFVEAQFGHAAGLLKVQTTAGGTLRQIRRPRAPTSRRLCAQAARHRWRGAVGELHQRAPARQRLEHAADDGVDDLGGQRQQRQSRDDSGDLVDPVRRQQARQTRRVALDDLGSAKMPPQKGGEFRVTLHQGQPSGGYAGGQQCLGHLAGAGAELDHVTLAALDDGQRRLSHGFGKQASARHDRPHGEGTAQPALQEEGSAGAFG